MAEDDTQSPEISARSDASHEHDCPFLSVDGTTWTDLTAVQRDCLEIVSRRENDANPVDEPEILRTLERRSPVAKQTHRYADLMVLVGRVLLSRRVRHTERTSEYRLTDEGRALLLQRAERLAEICGIRTVEAEPATETVARDGGKNG
ncbi:PadR family transcriptional regulator [Natrinema halophilum]|uniref:PadR family transcriptional regulator n=1 Tax=Natrinema halophilum TaxID=1699371 RepID=A0A7D5H7C2_9EURY|nr:PadR family transcriptional regulator [Natrinema halophilum]QLG49135.1 PadR family transcriptional regulator [Natrinema halophilum]